MDKTKLDNNKKRWMLSFVFLVIFSIILVYYIEIISSDLHVTMEEIFGVDILRLVEILVLVCFWVSFSIYYYFGKKKHSD